MKSYPILRHPNCKDDKCNVCFVDHINLNERLGELCGTNNRVDHLGKYHDWMSKNGKEPETEWGWATPESFLRENIDAYVEWWKE